MSKIRSMSLTTRIMIGMALGVAVGFIFQAILAGEDDYLIPLGLFSLPIKSFFVDGLLVLRNIKFITVITQSTLIQI